MDNNSNNQLNVESVAESIEPVDNQYQQGNNDLNYPFIFKNED